MFKLICAALLLATYTTANQVALRFRSYDVVTDIVDVAPTEWLDVTYPGNIRIHFGRVLRPNQVESQPQVHWNANSNDYYTLMFIDPDSPSVPEHANRSVKRWLVGNIRGNDISTGDVLASYSGPQPLQNSGLHRYVFLLYRQNGRVDFNEPRTEEARLRFNVRNFMQRYNLGNPIAGNLYECRG